MTSAFSAVSLSDRKGRIPDDSKDKGNKKQENKVKPKVKCFYCKKKGYLARECCKKQRDRQREPNKINENSAFVATVSRQANKLPVVPSSKEIQVLNSLDPEDIWITDSGASRHMTYRREWLIEFKWRSRVIR